MPYLTIRYFAILREQAGRESEELQTLAESPVQLYEELRQRYSFTLPGESLRVAINNEFGSMGAPLHEGDEVAFIAPVAGG